MVDIDFSKYLDRNKIKEGLGDVSSNQLDYLLSDIESSIQKEEHKQNLNNKEIKRIENEIEIATDAKIDEVQKNHKQIYGHSSRSAQGIWDALSGGASKREDDINKVIKEVKEQFSEELEKETDLYIETSDSKRKVKNLLNSIKILKSLKTKTKSQERYAKLKSFEGKTRETGKGIIKDIRDKTSEKYLCPYCNLESDKDDSHVDHIHPVSKGGLSVEMNMVLVCAACNLKKKDMTLFNFTKKYDLDFEEIATTLGKLGKDV